MRLTKLEMNGFKSFSKKTELDFNNGIAAVVGPNGSGKSNIADAVRWVLGEQSARALRGSKMEDVIFNGTEKKKPQSYCEVTLTFDNADGLLHTPYTEVAVTRRLYRSGDGEYLLNNSACRLKDIVDLFRDTGIGKEGYSIIGQGRVDEILSNKSNERRNALEEAAGVMRYRARKEEALRKLDHTEKNLVRITDILTELKERLDPLKEQSEAAKAFLLYRDELRDLEVNLFIRQYDRCRERLAAIAESLTQLFEESEQGALRAEELLALCREGEERLAAMDEDLSVRREELMAAVSEADRLSADKALLSERRSNLLSEIEQHQAAAAAAREEMAEKTALIAGLSSDEGRELLLTEARKDAEARQAELDGFDVLLSKEESDLEEEKNRVMDALNRLADAKSGQSRYDAMEQALQQRLTALSLKEEEAAKDHEALSARVQEAEEGLAALNTELSSLREREAEALRDRKALEDRQSALLQDRSRTEQNITALKARHRLLSEMARNREGYFASIRSLLADADRDPRLKSAIVGVVAELIRVPGQYEAAVTQALGAALQNIVTHTAEDAKYVIEYLRRRDYGRATILPMDQLRITPLPPRDRALANAKNCFGIASELIEFDEEIRPAMEYLLGRTVITEDLSSAIALKKQASSSFQIATLSGDIISGGGSMSGGSLNKKGNMFLSRERELTETAEGLKKAEGELARHDAALSGLQKELSALEVQTAAFQTAIREQELQIVRAKEQTDTLRRDADDCLEDLTSYREESADIRENLASIQREKLGADEEAEHIEAGSAAARDRIRAMTMALMERRRKREALSEEVTAALLKLNTIEKEQDAAANEVQRLQAELLRLSNRAEACDRDGAAARDRLTALEGAMQQTNEEHLQKGRAAEDRKRELSLLEEQRTKLTEEIGVRRREWEQVLQANNAIEEKRHHEELARSKTETELTSAQDHIWEEYELTYDNALALKRDIPLGTAGHRVSELKTKIRALGDIRVDSIEECRLVSERYEELNTQYEDVCKAKEDLVTLIADLTAAMKKEFLARFDEIDGHFREVFRELFGGGHAELRLADRSDALNCAIEIAAQPPGKKLQHLSLMSGGERALTAIALLFAMLQLKPPAFCILDEIESALDEVNVSRFANYLKNYSASTQFILITHRKGSMEVCDTLYGVSMEEKGVSKIVSARFTDDGKLAES